MKDEVWIVDRAGNVRTPDSPLPPSARKAFVQLVGEAGLQHLLDKDRQRVRAAQEKAR